MTTKVRTAEEMRREIADHLVSIAGRVPAGTSTKEIFRRLETRLAHPEINGRMVKALWYREVKSIPAHIADHIRSQVEAPPEASFVIDLDGRIRSTLQGVVLAPIRGRVEASRISLEISPSRAPYQGVATLRHWLLSQVTAPRPFRLTDLDRGVTMEASGPLAALDRLEDWLKESPGRPAALIQGPAMFADERGVKPLDAAALEFFGIHPEADFDVPAFLARNMGVVTFMIEGQGLRVLARASGRSTRAVENAAAYLAMRIETVRLSVWWGGSWLRERETDGVVAARRLRRLCNLAEPATPPALYDGERVRLEDVPAIELDPYLQILSLVGRPLESSAIGRLLAAGAGDRLTVAEVTDGVVRIVFCPYGPDYYGSNWSLRAVGRAISDQPDQAYGAAVEQRFADAFRDNVVHFERVRATIKEFGGSTAGEHRRSSYSRLIVPFNVGGRRLALAYASFIRQPETVG
jgi:hypothetical protein